jgi:hypothetical protein
MLTGQKVFDAKSEIKILEMVRAGQYTPARQLEPSIPLALEQILNKALTTDREKRYQSAAELEYALHGFLYSLGYRTSDGELSVFVRKTLGLPDRQHNTLIPPAPADVGEKVQLVSPLVGLMMEEESTENRLMQTADFDSQLDTDTSAFREEKTSIVQIEEQEEELDDESRLRESRTEMFSIDVLEASAETENTMSQNPTVVRPSPLQSPSLEPVAPVAKVDGFSQQFSMMDGRQKFETIAAALLGLLWLGISIYHAAY